MSQAQSSVPSAGLNEKSVNPGTTSALHRKPRLHPPGLMRFHHRNSPSRFMNRRDRRRVFMMVALLGGVIITYQQAKDPDNYRWFTELSGVDNQAPPPDLRELDFRVRPERGPRTPDELRVELAAAPIDAQSADAGLDSADIDIPAEVLQPIEDNRMGALRREQAALEFTLDRARTLPQQQLNDAAERDVAFTVLMVRPDDYRGRPVHLRGVLRQLKRLERPGMGDDDPPVYEAWMIPRDAGNNPVRILLTDLTPGIEPGTELSSEVEVAAWFFKRYGYVSEGGEHVAPMLIGKSLELIPVRPLPNPERVSHDLGRFALGFFLVMSCVFGLIVWRFAASDRRFRRSRMQELADARLAARHEDLAALQNVDIIDPNNMFADLERNPPTSGGV